MNSKLLFIACFLLIAVTCQTENNLCQNCQNQCMVQEGKNAAQCSSQCFLSCKIEAFRSLLPVGADNQNCAHVDACGRAYQACCLVAGDCNCHLQDGSGQAGSSCGGCGAAFQVCCLATKCNCDVEPA